MVRQGRRREPPDLLQRGRRIQRQLGLARAYYHCDTCRAGICPRDRALGLHATSLSPGVLRMVGLAASDFSFAAASGLLWELAAVRVETKQVERAAEALGREVAADECDVADTVPQPRADHVPGAGRHRCAGAPRRGRRPPRQAARRFGQDPRGQAGHHMDGRRARQGGPARARPRVGQLQRCGRERGQPRHRPVAVRLRPTCLSRGATARLRHRGPPGRHRRRRPLDLAVGRRAVSRRHRNRRHLPRQAASVRRGQDHLRPRNGLGRPVGQGPACRVGRRPAPRRRRGATHPCRDHARGAKVHSLCVREPTPHALSAVPRQGPVHLSGRRRDRLQADRRTAQARRHALDRRRRQRHHRPPLLPAQRPLRGLLGDTSRKRRSQ